MWAPSPTLWPLTLILAHLEEDGLPISTASWSGGSSSPPALAPGTPFFQQVPANIPSPASPPDLRWNLQWTIALHSEPMRPGTEPGAAGLGLPLWGLAAAHPRQRTGALGQMPGADQDPPCSRATGLSLTVRVSPGLGRACQMAVVWGGHTYTHCFEHLRPWKTGAQALCRQAGVVLGASHLAEG